MFGYKRLILLLLFLKSNISILKKSGTDLLEHYCSRKQRNIEANVFFEKIIITFYIFTNPVYKISSKDFFSFPATSYAWKIGKILSTINTVV